MVRNLEQSLTGFARRNGTTLLRVSLGVLFLWFGVLKVIDRSPVANEVIATLFWAPNDHVVLILGVIEVVVGLALLAGIAVSVVYAFFWAQLASVLVVFIFRSGTVFLDGNPFLLTSAGDYVVRTLVLAVAGIAVAGAARR